LLVLDSGGVSRLAERSTRALALISSLRSAELWPPVVPTMVLVESLQARPGRDANVNRFVKTCILEDAVPLMLARRAAELRRRAGRGSAVDALVAAIAEPGGAILSGDVHDLAALAAHADHVAVLPI
jgi:predicted nucleic acid-binding protein